MLPTLSWADVERFLPEEKSSATRELSQLPNVWEYMPVEPLLLASEVLSGSC